jgi:hypothetical protein
MTNLSKLIAVALAGVVLTTSFANAGSVVVNGGQILKLRPVAACQLASGEFPDDLWITNKGAGVLAKGTKVKWNVAFANATGTYTLAADLAPGKSVYLANVIPSTEAGHDCKATVIA